MTHDTDSGRYRHMGYVIPSLDILHKAISLTRACGYHVGNVDRMNTNKNTPLQVCIDFIHRGYVKPIRTRTRPNESSQEYSWKESDIDTITTWLDFLLHYKLWKRV